MSGSDPTPHERPRQRTPSQQKPLWKTPSGISAIAALITALATAFGLLLAYAPRSDTHTQDPGTAASGIATPTTSVASPAASSASSDSTFKRVFHPSGAISAEVPADWEAGSTSIRHLATGEPTGPALDAVEDSSKSGSWKVDEAVVGASTSLWTELGLPGVSGERRLELVLGYLRGADWTLQGCTFESESEYTKSPYTGLVRRWRNCGQVGARFWEMIALPADAEFVAHVQISFTDASDVLMAERVLETFDIDAHRLPADSSPAPSRSP